VKQIATWGAIALLTLLGALLINGLLGFLYRAVNHG
jgi:hypothetical protein